MAPVYLTRTLIAATPAFAGGAAPDLCALADVKLELNITDSLSDAYLAAVITRLSMQAANYCNRTFQLQTYEDRIWPVLDIFPWQVPGGLTLLRLSQFPVASQISPSGAAPPVEPVLSQVPGGTLGASPYYVRATYVTNAGETACSLEARLPLAANNLLQVAAPPIDNAGIATGWNVYIGPASFAETLQNAVPLPIGAAFTLPGTGLIAGAAPPSYVTVVENCSTPVSPVMPSPPASSDMQPSPLAEGVDFLVQNDRGILSRLYLNSNQMNWPALPVCVQYQAGFATIPLDLQDAMIRMVKARWFARSRDPMVRQENVEGVYSATYWFGTGPGSPADMPNDAAAFLDRNYRVPVIA